MSDLNIIIHKLRYLLSNLTSKNHTSILKQQLYCYTVINNNITDIGCSFFITGIFIYLQCIKLINLLAGLEKNNTLCRLNLSHNSLSDSSINLLSSCLEHNLTITELELGHNNIKNEGIRCLSSVLINSKIVKLGLGNYKLHS